MYTSLALLKKNVRADDFTDDDELLSFLLESAERQVINETQRKEEELLIDGDLPLDLKQAAVLLASYSYRNRDGGTPQDITALGSTMCLFLDRYHKDPQS